MFVVELLRRYRGRRWWPGLVVLLSLTAGTALYLTDIYSIFADWPPAPLWMHYTLLLCMCTAQLFRNKAPLGALTVAVAFTIADISIGITIPVIIVLVDLLFNATMYSSRRASRRIVVVVVLVVLTLGISAGVAVGNWRASFLVTINAFSLLIVPVWWAFNVRYHWEVAEAERANSRQLARINELDRRAAVSAERGRMARDLHDVVAGHLSAIAIQSEALLSMVDGDPELVRKVLRSVRQNSIQSLDEMRAMIDVLRADAIEEDPRTAPARLAELDRLVDSARAGGLDVVVEVHDVDGLPVPVDLAAYRIVQEALTNALKHAVGAAAEVAVAAEDGKLVVEVTNSLTGEPGSGMGTGLVNMRERAHAVGGSFAAGPWAGGWRVRAELPMEGSSS